MSRPLESTILALLMAAGFGTSAHAGDAAGSRSPDVRHYDVDVVLHDASMHETVTVYATAVKAPKHWTLELAPQMKVVSADCGGRAVAVSAKDWTIDVDLSDAQIKDGVEFSLTLHVEGAPLEENPRLGFTRSAVRPDVAYTLRRKRPAAPTRRR